MSTTNTSSIKTIVQLPLFEDKTILPTNKFHVSYSEVSDWMDCSFRHKLKHVLKISMEENDGSIHTSFGKAIHDAIEKYLTSKVPMNSDDAIVEFKKLVAELHVAPTEKDVLDFSSNLPDMIGQVPDWLEETFPGWKTVAAEFPLFESVDKQPNINFKGFIDAIISVPKKRGGGREYWILDWKTCSWGWKTEQKQKYQKQLQLMLYKHYFCQLMKVDLKDVKCGFVLIKRVAPKTRKPGDRLELVPVSVGPKAIEKAQATLHEMINRVKGGFASKNRMSCEPFCPYLHTEHCR